jgi:hypothetical protein
MDTEHVIYPNQTEVKINGQKKKSPRKKSPPKLSIKQNLLLEKLKLFYENKSNMNQLLDIINSTSKISLRIIDWFVTNYSKKNFVVIPVKKVTSSLGDKVATKTQKKNNIVEKDVNVFLNYKAQLKAYSKKQFDPFCRRERISYKYSDNKSIVTTVGQLNFFKWAIENNILLYINDNIKDIEEDMNLNIKKPPSKKKKSIKNLTPQKVNLCKGSPKRTPISSITLSKQRKKRRELSTSAVKSLNKHPGNIVLSFD